MNFSTLRLRPYQLEAQQAIVEALKRGFRAQLVSLATGLGKTVVIATLPELLELRPTDVTLVVAHRDELIQQLVERMKMQNPDAIVGVEKADEYAAEECTIVVATVQTLTGPRLNRFAAKFGRRIALFVIDEAHHAAAPTYRAILDKILTKRPDATIIGFTATPHRGDGIRLTEIFPDIVYTMDARAAIDAGYLVPVRSYAVNTETNLDEVGSRAGDFILGQLAEAVDTEERNLRVLEAYQTLTPGKKTLVFTASVEHAKNVAALFKEAKIKAAFASGDTPQAEREAIVAGFRGSKIDVLVNCGLYLEGFDVPSIEVIINARPTKSTTLYTQVTGRGMRPLDEYAYVLSELPSAEARREVIAQSGKPYEIIIDIVDQARRHQLVTLPTLWGLPAQIDAQGRPISGVAERYEELFRRAPREAARVRTAEQIENALIELDEAAKPKKAQSAAWQPVGPDHW
ncbi:MAG: DEAD/DEAH box helicase, partial [Candidatus Baltobacteraceae bacterium]